MHLTYWYHIVYNDHLTVVIFIKMSLIAATMTWALSQIN